MKCGCSSEFIFTFRYGDSSIQNASEQFASCIHLSFVHFGLRPTPQQESKGMRSVDWNNSLGYHSKSDICLYDFFCNDRYYRLPNYCHFLVNHPVYQEFLMSSWSKLQIYNKTILLSKICPVAGIFNTLLCLSAFLFVLNLSKSIITFIFGWPCISYK
jgi:hypothetical protein